MCRFSRPAATLTIIILCLYDFVASDARTVKIGILYSGSGTLEPQGQTYPVVASMWSSWTLQQPHGLGGLDIYPELYLYDVASIASAALLGLQELIGNNISVVVGPETGLIETVVAACLNAEPPIPVISTMDSSSKLFGLSFRAYPNLFGTLTPMTQYFTNLYPLIRRQYSRLTFIYVDDPLDTDVCTGSLTDATMQGLDIVGLHVVNSSQDYALSIAAILSHVSNIERPEVLFFCGYMICDDFLLGLKYSGWIPSVVVAFECTGLATHVVDSNDPDLIDAYRYIVSPQQWDARLVGRRYVDSRINLTSAMFPISTETLSSAELFNSAFQLAANGLPMNSTTASQMAGLYAIATAVMLCNCTTSTGIMESMQKVTLSSFYGLIDFDLNGQNSIKDMVYIQLDSALDSHLLYPSTPVTIEPIWPIPTYEERIYSNKILSQSSEIAVLILAVVGALLCVSLSVCLIVYRRHPGIQPTSPWFTCVFLWGCGTGCLWTSSWLLNNTQLMCSFRNPGMSLALGMMLSSLLAKTSRIARIFDMQKLQTQKITDWHVARVMLLLLIPLLLLTCIGEIARPTVSTRYTVDPIRSILDYTDCVYQLPALVFPFLGWIVINLAFCLYYAYRVRGAYAEFNEARAITRIVGLLIILFVVNVVLVIWTTVANREVIFACRSLCNLAVFSGAAVVLILERVKAVWSANIVHPDGGRRPDPLTSPCSRKPHGSQTLQRSPIGVDLQLLKPQEPKKSPASRNHSPGKNLKLLSSVSPKSQSGPINTIQEKPKYPRPPTPRFSRELPSEATASDQISSPHTRELIALNQTIPVQLTDPQSESITAMPDASRSERDVESSDTVELQDTQPETGSLESQSSHSNAETEPSRTLSSISSVPKRARRHQRRNTQGLIEPDHGNIRLLHQDGV